MTMTRTALYLDSAGIELQCYQYHSVQMQVPGNKNETLQKTTDLASMCARQLIGLASCGLHVHQCSCCMCTSQHTKD